MGVFTSRNKIAIIGSGVAGLSAAAFLGKAGHEVTVFEKNSEIGGRVRQIQRGSYKFDLGPTWYWMPDVFEHFFERFDVKAQDYYELKKLSPSFQVIFGKNDVLSIPSDFQELCALFESLETGAGKSLETFMDRSRMKYEISVKRLINKPYVSMFEMFDFELLANVFRYNLFSSFAKYIRKYFSHPKLLPLMEFPILFLGASPKKTPSLYSLLNYSGLKIGTYYPMGGFSKVIEAMRNICERYNITINTNSEVQQINVAHKRVSSLTVDNTHLSFDAVLGAADYHHLDQHLLKKPLYTQSYWNSRVLAPSALIFHVAVNKKIPNLEHHNLFFEFSLHTSAEEIYTTKQWPRDPLFYVCCPSKSDPSLAPPHHDILYILMPIAVGLEDTQEIRDKYYRIVLTRLEDHIGVSLAELIVDQFSYCSNDFKNDYHAFGGNAYGLANTLGQSAVFKPKMFHRKIRNLFFAGQFATPGPGVPPSIISGSIASDEITKYLELK